MPHFRKGNDAENNLVAEILEKYHSDLHEAELIVDVLVAFATKNEQGEPRGPALSHGGYPAIATVRVNSLKSRVLGQGDALITLDGDRWGDYSPEQQRAIIDHELTHLELITSDEGGVEGDDIGRPRLRCRKHDHQFGWFDAVVRRHGRYSVEWSQFKLFQDTALKQTWLPGFEGHEDSESDAIDDAVRASSRDPNAEGLDLDEACEKLMDAVEASGVKVHRNVTVELGGHGVKRTKGNGRKAAASAR